MAKNKTTQTSVETCCFSRKEVENMLLPPFQRGERPNAKVMDLTAALNRDHGVIPGIICFGVLDKKKYLIDGLQRRHAFLASSCREMWADIRYCYFESMAEMAEEFIRLNGHLVSMKPDDILRAAEFGIPSLQIIRKACPFVGYDFIRRDASSPLLSMSVVLRVWAGASAEVPWPGGASSVDRARMLDEHDADVLCQFLNCCFNAWKRDQVYVRLWNALSMTMTGWLYRRLVYMQHSAKTRRIDDAMFTKCLMSLSASEAYLDWLVGRHLGQNDRVPCYNRIKEIFATRLHQETGVKHMLPAPEWAHG